MAELKSLTFVEVDVDYCELRYGETTDAGTCSAVLGEDSERKCFNSIATCAIREDLQLSPVTLRFAIPTAYLAASGIVAIPSIDDLSITPAVISLGENLGQRATLRVTFNDHPWSDAGEGFDKYAAERDYDPFKKGTFWPKFRARQPFLRGRKMRLVQGVLGQSLSEMEVRHYVIDSFDGPTPDGQYTIIAKDPIKMADGTRAQAPRVSNGFLSGDIEDDDTELTITPSGVGDAEYPEAGLVAIGGKEIMAFTRVGDVFTVTRGQSNTEAVEHSAGDRVQLCLEYSGEDAADVIYDLFVNYAGIAAGYIDLVAWKEETVNFLRRQYSAIIAEPTSVSKLASELVEQAALAIWWDDLAQRIRLQVLRQIPTDVLTYGETDYIEGSLSSREQPEKRVSQVWTYFGQINPLEGVDDADNYRSIAATVDVQSETDEGTPAIKKIFARWTPAGGRALALRVNDIQIGRYKSPPRRVNFDLFRYPELARQPQIGGGYSVASWHFQDGTGEVVPLQIQVTRLAAEADRYRLECEQMNFVSFDPEDLDNRVIIYDSNIPNVNVRATHDLLYPPAEDGDEVTVVVEQGAIVWSQSVGAPAMIIGDWPTGVAVNLVVRGRIQGRAGNGGAGAPWRNQNGSPGTIGGPALYTRNAISVTLDEGNGQIWGGGGGGGGGGYGETRGFFGQVSNRSGGGGGGGGSGFIPGTGGIGGDPSQLTGQPGNPGTPTDPGAGGIGGSYRAGIGGAGGGPGLVGANGANGWTTSGGAGGAPGDAIDGVSFVTKTGTGDVRGPEVN